MASAPISIKKRRFEWSVFSFKFLLLLPAAFMLLIFMAYPIIEVFRISLTDSTLYEGNSFVGLKNYFKLFDSESFRAGFIHVLQWAFWSVIIQIPLAFFIAFACTTYQGKFVRGMRSIYYLGNVFPSVITAMLGTFLFTPTSGIVVSLAKVFKWGWLEKIDFFGNTDIVFWSIFGIATWAYIGFGIIYFMANIEQIPPEIREAAYIDGANKWQYARHIVIPSISYALGVQAILCTVGSLKLFDLPWLLTRGGPNNASTTLGIVLYQEGWLNSQYGKGAAVGVVIFLLSLIFTIIQFSRLRTAND